MKNPNLKVTTVSININDWRQLRAKLALQGKDISEWIRLKVKEELQKN